MIAIQTKTGSKVHALEPKCMDGDYDYPFHPLCTGGRGRKTYRVHAVKRLGANEPVTCKRCLKIIAMDTVRFSSDSQVSSRYGRDERRYSATSAMISLLVGFALLCMGIWGYFFAS